VNSALRMLANIAQEHVSKEANGSQALRSQESRIMVIGGVV
jgi:hypothetical protein